MITVIGIYVGNQKADFIIVPKGVSGSAAEPCKLAYGYVILNYSKVKKNKANILFKGDLKK